MKKPFFMFVLLVVVLLCSPFVYAQTTTITWGTTFQTIDGFGASVGTNYGPSASLTNTQVVQFFSVANGLGFSLLRDSVPDNGDCTSVNNGCAGDYLDMQSAIAYGARVWSTPWSPPASMKTNGSVNCSPDSGALSAGSYAAYAAYLSNYITSLSNLGINLYALSVQNEPDFCATYDAALWTDTNFDTFIKTNLGPTLATAGQTAVRVMLPESSKFSTFTSLADTCMADSSCYNYVGINAWHDYDASYNPPNSTSNPYSSLNKGYWETEASAGPGFGPSLCGGCWDPSMADGLLWAAIIDDRMAVENNNAWMYWWFISYNSDNEGLLYSDGVTTSKRMFVMGNYSKFVRPGWVRMSATHTPVSGVTVSAYKDPSGTGNFAIVATNQNSSGTSVTFSLSGFSATTVTPWYTDANNNLVQQSSITANTSFTTTLGASSVTTFVGTATAATGSGVIATSRSIDWSHAGAGTIPTRTTVCATPALLVGSDQAVMNGIAIRSAIANCPSGQVVYLIPGSWYVDYILWGNSFTSMVSNVTLRGAGPMSTDIIFTTGSACNGLGSDLCLLNGDGVNFFSGNPINLAAWTSGYTKGLTTITLGAFINGSLSNLHKGMTLILDQTDDGLSDPGNIWVCQIAGQNPSCAYEGGDSGLPGAAQTQMVQVTNVSGSTITISPGLYAPNWRNSQNPMVWFSNFPEITGDGIENMTLDHSQSSVAANYGGGSSGIMMGNAYGNWIKNVRSINHISSPAVGKHVWLYQANHNTVRDSYFFGSDGNSSGYGVDSGTTGSDNLIENNIFQKVAGAEITEGDSGSVFGYNYSVDNYYNGAGTAPNFQQEEAYNHSAGGHYTLWEGNEGIGMTGDTLHGTSFMLTQFRNRWNGRDPSLTSGFNSQGQDECAGVPPTGASPCYKTYNTAAVALKAGSREMNIIGNVLGTAGYHTTYTITAPNAGDCGTVNNLAVFLLDYSGNDGNSATCSGFPFPIANDLNVHTTLYRWGNLDPTNGGAGGTAFSVPQFNTSEVPNGLGQYAQPIPSTDILPASLYQPNAPPWWGSMPWPAIGSDVSGGNVPNVGGHVFETPSALCYLGVMGGKTDGSSGVLAFDSSNCYNGTVTPPPSAPTNLKAVVN